MEQPSQKAPDNVLSARELKIERKRLTIEMRENFRGRYMKIVEYSGGKRNIVIIPEHGINDFNACIDGVIADVNR